MSYYSLILADDPALYWPLDSTYGATDQSGNGRNGTGSGGVTVGGYSGSPISGETSATDFPGASKQVTSSYSVFSGVRTFSTWARRTSTADSGLLGGDNVATAPLLVLASSDRIEWRFRANDSGATSQATWLATGTSAAGSWYHIAIVVNDTSDTAEMFVNGVSKGVVSGLSVGYSSAGSFQIGLAPGFAWGNGQLAHVAVWERALTASEIQSHYQAGVGSGLTADKNYIHQAGRGQ